eukprot:3548615-Rhodomonas_salina.1
MSGTGMLLRAVWYCGTCTSVRCTALGTPVPECVVLSWVYLYQVDIHVEKTDYFQITTHGVNEYTYLQYINVRLVEVLYCPTLCSYAALFLTGLCSYTLSSMLLRCGCPVHLRCVWCRERSGQHGGQNGGQS